MATIGNTSHKRQPNNGGFSLVEMAIVVVLMGIFLTLGLAAFNAQLNNAALSTTKKKQEIIREALIAYLRDFKRLPCPEVTAFGVSAPNGVEGRQTAGNPASNCSSFWGTLPYAELGLSRDIALDGYENFFTYFVSSALAGEPDWTLTQVAGVPGFSVGNPGRFAITENGTATTLSKNLAAVVIVSHGSNGLGAFTSKGYRNALPANGTDERQNAPDTSVNSPPGWVAPSLIAVVPPTLPNPSITALIIRDRTETPAPFDDVVLAIRPNDLLSPIVKDGALKSAEALIQEQLATVRDVAIAQMLSNACNPVPVSTFTTNYSPSGLPLDPWGSTIVYGNPSGTPLTLTTNGNAVAFRVWSMGPDRASGTSDDRILSTGIDITFAQVRARIPATACP